MAHTCKNNTRQKIITTNRGGGTHGKCVFFFFFFLSWKMKKSFLARLVRQKEYGGQENVPEPNCRLHFLINYGLLNALVLSPVK